MLLDSRTATRNFLRVHPYSFKKVVQSEISKKTPALDGKKLAEQDERPSRQRPHAPYYGLVYRYLLIVTLIESRGPCIVDGVWTQTNTVHKCRRLESRTWEKKSSRFQLKSPGAQGEKKLASDKKLPPSLWRAQGRGVQFSLAGSCSLAKWHKLCPLLGVGSVARPRRYRTGHLRSAGARV